MNWINRAWKKSMGLANSMKKQRQFYLLILTFVIGIIAFKGFSGELELMSFSIWSGVIVLSSILVLFRSSCLFVPLTIWLMVGQVLGEVTSTLVLGIIYYLIFFPITFLIRIFKKNADSSGWREIKSSYVDYKKMY